MRNAVFDEVKMWIVMFLMTLWHLPPFCKGLFLAAAAAALSRRTVACSAMHSPSHYPNETYCIIRSSELRFLLFVIWNSKEFPSEGNNLCEVQFISTRYSPPMKPLCTVIKGCWNVRVRNPLSRLNKYSAIELSLSLSGKRQLRIQTKTLRAQHEMHGADNHPVYIGDDELWPSDHINTSQTVILKMVPLKRSFSWELADSQ